MPFKINTYIQQQQEQQNYENHRATNVNELSARFALAKLAARAEIMCKPQSKGGAYAGLEHTL